MVAKRYAIVDLGSGEIEENERKDVAKQVADQMQCVGYDGDGVCQLPSHQLDSYEDNNQEDGAGEYFIIVGVVFGRRGMIQMGNSLP